MHRVPSHPWPAGTAPTTGHLGTVCRHTRRPGEASPRRRPSPGSCRACAPFLLHQPSQHSRLAPGEENTRGKQERKSVRPDDRAFLKLMPDSTRRKTITE